MSVGSKPAHYCDYVDVLVVVTARLLSCVVFAAVLKYTALTEAGAFLERGYATLKAFNARKKSTAVVDAEED